MTAANLCVHPSKANFIIDWESWAAGKFSFTTIFSYRPVIFCPRAKYWNPCFLEHPLLQGLGFVFYLLQVHLFLLVLMCLLFTSIPISLFQKYSFIYLCFSVLPLFQRWGISF